MKITPALLLWLLLPMAGMSTWGQHIKLNFVAHLVLQYNGVVAIKLRNAQVHFPPAPFYPEFLS